METSGVALPLILASASPRRAALLAQLGLSFRVQEVAVDEEALGGPALGPAETARRRAAAKAQAGLVLCPEALVLGADTLVSLDGEILGKPGDALEARGMLSRLSGREHTVFTAIALVCRGEQAEAVEYAQVAFRPLDDAEVAAYAGSPEARDKAGAYAVQGAAAAFVRRIAGEYTTIVGLPLCRLSVMLRQFGIRAPAPVAALGGAGPPAV